MAKWADTDERYNTLTAFGEEDKRISIELLGPMYFESRKPGYNGPQVKALDFKAYRKYIAEREHMKLYEQAIYSSEKIDAPEWHELPKEEQDRIRQLNDNYKKDMNDVGDIISTFSPKI